MYYLCNVRERQVTPSPSLTYAEGINKTKVVLNKLESMQKGRTAKEKGQLCVCFSKWRIYKALRYYHSHEKQETNWTVCVHASRGH